MLLFNVTGLEIPLISDCFQTNRRCLDTFSTWYLHFPPLGIYGCHDLVCLLLFIVFFFLNLTCVRVAPWDMSVPVKTFVGLLGLVYNGTLNLRTSSFPNSDFSIKKVITNRTNRSLLCWRCRCLRVNERDGWWQSTGRTSRYGCRSPHPTFLDVISPLE